MLSLSTFLGVFLGVRSDTDSDFEGVFLTGVKLFSHFKMLLRLLLGLESASSNVCPCLVADLVSLIELTLSHKASLSSEMVKRENC